MMCLTFPSDVDRLCNEIKEEIIENLEGESFQLTYERSTECEIPDDWTRVRLAWRMFCFTLYLRQTFGLLNSSLIPFNVLHRPSILNLLSIENINLCLQLL